jgi:nucleoside 2-deoxyribosyltransferase
MKIYLAGPLFTYGEIAFNKNLAEMLIGCGYEVFLPQEACAGKASTEIYQTCLRGLALSDVIVAILDGADADSGTCWECGYGVARGMPVIGVRTDFRKSGDTKGFNAMLYYSASAIVEAPAIQSKIIEALQAIG